MKLKTYFNAALLCLAAGLLAACADDIMGDGNKDKQGKEEVKGVHFEIDKPKLEGSSRAVVNEDGTTNAKTRTIIKHTIGNGADAYWSDDDKIWVRDKNGEWKQSISTEVYDEGRRATFILPGDDGDYNDNCAVSYITDIDMGTVGHYYTGDTGILHDPDDYNIVIGPATMIASEQNQTRVNDFSQAGKWGDCGIGVAKRVNGKFEFTLDHKSSYLCLLPRCENASLGANIELTNIRIEADTYLSSDILMFPTTGVLDMLGYVSGSWSSKYINATVNNFPLTNTTTSLETNACYFVVLPGTHNFTITYTLKDKVTGMEGDVVKHVNGVVCNPGEINDLSANVTPPAMTAKYYAWDVDEVDDCWHGYESEQPVISQELPGATDSEHGAMNENSSPVGQPFHNGDPRASRWESGMFITDVAHPFFKANVPNSNELLWYAAKGDPHWDGRRAWALKDHLYAGGMWFKKRAKICADEHITEADMKSKFKVEAPNSSIYLGQDVDHQLDAGGYVNTSASISQPVPNQTDYFFLPAAGYYNAIIKPYDPSHPFRVWTGLFHAGQAGYYWSRSIDYSASIGIHGFYFNEGVVLVDMNNYTQVAAIRYPLSSDARGAACLPVIKFQ